MKNNTCFKGHNHSEEYKKEQSKRKKEYYKTHAPWNKGLILK